MSDFYEKESNCCGALVENERDGMGVCSDCKEPCEAIYPPCPLGICDGSGEVQSYDSPIEPHLPSTPAGVEPCPCTKDEDADYDPDD